jgi:hypothetical protein
MSSNGHFRPYRDASMHSLWSRVHYCREVITEAKAANDQATLTAMKQRLSELMAEVFYRDDKRRQMAEATAAADEPTPGAVQ